jgi:hypothetical protein
MNTIFFIIVIEESEAVQMFIDLFTIQHLIL